MSRHTLLSAAAGLSLALLAAPLGALHAQNPRDSAVRRALPTIKPAPTPTTPGAAQQARTQAVADTAFIREARAGNLFEVQLGTVAGRKASSSAVKEFAGRMVTDHTNLGNQWSALITRNGLPGKASLDANQQQTVTRLDGLSGAEFDRAYMTEMVQDHRKDVATFQRMGSAAQSPEVRQLAATSLTTIQQHLTMAEQVANQVGAGAVAAAAPRPQPGVTGGRVTTQGGRVTTGGLRADQEYVGGVSQGHIMEVRLAEMARDKANDPKVKQFAENMLSDFNRYRDRWIDLAHESGIENPHMGNLHQDKVDRLSKASRGNFDRVYLDIVTENLGSMVPYFQKEGRAAHSAKVRNLVDDELPTLRQHLSRAEELSRQLHTGANPSERKRPASSRR